MVEPVSKGRNRSPDLVVLNSASLLFVVFSKTSKACFSAGCASGTEATVLKDRVMPGIAPHRD